jgi:hypothetical protein
MSTLQCALTTRESDLSPQTTNHPLEHEAAHFFSAIFDGEPAANLKVKYRDAHDYMFKSISQAELHTIDVVVQNGLDVEAIEIFLRRKDRPHLLTMKLQALIYLAELSASHCALFVNQTDSQGDAVLTVIGALAKWPYSFIKGAYLAWRYELV